VPCRRKSAPADTRCSGWSRHPRNLQHQFGATPPSALRRFIRGTRTLQRGDGRGTRQIRNRHNSAPGGTVTWALDRLFAPHADPQDRCPSSSTAGRSPPAARHGRLRQIAPERRNLSPHGKPRICKMIKPSPVLHARDLARLLERNGHIAVRTALVFAARSPIHQRRIREGFVLAVEVSHKPGDRPWGWFCRRGRS